MVRVRLEGLPDEVQRIADAMQAAGCVLAVSYTHLDVYKRQALDQYSSSANDRGYLSPPQSAMTRLELTQKAIGLDTGVAVSYTHLCLRPFLLFFGSSMAVRRSIRSRVSLWMMGS